VSLQCHSPVPWISTAQGKPRSTDGPAILPRGDPERGSTFEEDLNSAPSQALAQVPKLPAFSTLPDCARCSAAEAVKVKAY